MLSLFIGIQYIGMIVLMMEIMYILRQKTSKLQTILLIVVIATLVNFAGYLFEIQATTKEMALQAVKFIYLGKPYIVLGTFLFSMQYYKVELSKVLKNLLCIMHAAISVLVITCDYHTLFYSSIDYVEEGFFPHLVLGHGILYNIYTFFIILYLFAVLVIGIKKYRSARDLKERRQIGFMIMIPCISAAGLFIFFSGVAKGYDTTLPAFLLCAIMLLILLLRYNLLDTVELAKESVMDEFADGLVVLDQNGKVMYVNKQITNIYPQFATGKYAPVLELLEELYQRQEKLFLGEQIYEIYVKDIIRDDIVYGKMLVVSDITENYHYTIRLEEQTAIANQANKTKSDFLAKMSHEIRTPINAVLGMNEMILRESRETDIKKYAMDIKASANTLLGIINDILDSSKIESGKLEILPINYELDSLLNDIINMVYVKARDKQLTFEVSVDDKLPNRQYGDDVRIRQILVNLLNNAMKYTQEGSVILKVSGKAEGDKVIMHYEVKDTGIGIKEEDMPKLCADFERIEESRNRNIEGTGLGMSIVVELLQLMGSKLSVDSVYGEGTCFSFDLEQSVVDLEPIGDFETRSKRRYEEHTYEVMFTAPKAKILVVDDNEINRKVFRNLLKQTHLKITELDSGSKCLEQVKKEHFDLIFMDHMMPDMDGVETLKRLNQLSEHQCKGVPVIILTANAVTGAKEYYLEQGFDGFLSKPVIGESLERMIIKHLPKELIETAEKGSALPDIGTIIPEIDEFELDYARQFFPTDEVLLETMVQVLNTMKSNEEQLEEFLKKGDIEGYRIQVHALKSSAAMVGALLLSKLARLLEIAAAQMDMERIRVLHPILLEEMEKHRLRMQVLEEAYEISAKGMQKSGNTDDIVQILSILEMLKNSLMESDYSAADFLIEQLGAFSYAEEEMLHAMERLRMQVLNMESAASEDTIDEIVKMMEGVM